MRLWLAAHAPSTTTAGKGAVCGAAEAEYRQFAQGHRFIDDLPVEAVEGEDDVK